MKGQKAPCPLSFEYIQLEEIIKTRVGNHEFVFDLLLLLFQLSTSSGSAGFRDCAVGRGVWTETFDAMVLPCHIRYERKLNREITNLEIVYIFQMYFYIFGPILAYASVLQPGPS